LLKIQETETINHLFRTWFWFCISVFMDLSGLIGFWEVQSQ